MASPEPPYLSVIVTTRNDDHGGDPLKRLQALVNTFSEQCRRSALDAEIVVVEWNPPAGKPRVSELIRVAPDAPVAVRFVEVPAEIHDTLRYADVLPLFQMIAKNVGVRRALGRFILCTNIDVVFSTELVNHLATRRLEAGHIYRIDRRDIQSDFPVDAPLEHQMAFCRTHQIRLHTRSGTYPVDSGGRMRTLDPDIASAGVTLDGGWRAREGEPKTGYRRWATGDSHLTIDRTVAPGLLRGAVFDLEVEPNPFQPDSWIEIDILDGERLLACRRVSRRTRVRIPLDDGRERHEITLRLKDSSGGQECLPVFESRAQLVYQVHYVGVGTVPAFDYDMALWRRAPNNSPKLLVAHGSHGVEITSDPSRYSYLAQYGPFEAHERAKYEFLLEFEPIENRFSLDVMDDESGCWLPSTSVEVETDGQGAHQFSVSVDLVPGTKFSLVLSNDCPRGGVSRFVLRRLRGSVAPEALRRASVGARPNLAWRAAHAVAEIVRTPFRRVGAALADIEAKRARRFEDTMVEESPRVRDLEAQVTALTPFTELAPLSKLLREHRPTELFQNACGDFQLMAREHWFDLRGYPEFEMFSMSIDGVFHAVATSAGIREEVFRLPLAIYHLEHEKGSGWTPEGEAQLKRRIAESGITWLESDAVHVWTTYMQWLRRPMIFNGQNWGFGDVLLPETTLHQPADKV